MKVKKEILVGILALLLAGAGAIAIWGDPFVEITLGGNSDPLKTDGAGGESAPDPLLGKPGAETTGHRELAKPEQAIEPALPDPHQILIDGFVRNDQGDPLAGVLVRCFSQMNTGNQNPPGKQGKPGAITKIRSTETTMDGSFSFTFPRPATGPITSCFLSACAKSHAPVTREIELTSTTSHFSLTLNLTSGVVVTGIVIDQDKKPVANALVWNG